MFVKLARRWAELGHPCLRFDFGGRGESDGGFGDASIQSMVADARAAVAFTRERTGVPIVLAGICSGAKVAVMTACREEGVDGLLLWSADPLGDGVHLSRRRARSLAALRTYAAKLRRPETWKKALAGKLDFRSIGRAVSTPERADRSERENERDFLREFAAFRAPVLFVNGECDAGSQATREAYAEFCRKHGLTAGFAVVPGAGHSFYSLASETRVADLSTDWLRTRFAGSAPTGAEGIGPHSG